MRSISAVFVLFIIVTGTAAGQYFRGVNVSQAEWGDPLDETPGIGYYTYAMAPTFNYFAARGLPVIRLQVKWERLQPTLNGPLDSPQLGYLQQDIAYAKAAGAQVIIVPHNEARYATLESQVANYDQDACIIDNPCPGSPEVVTTDNFVNFWVQMSTAFKDDPTVVAYDLTNEPHDMGVASWAQIAQAAVTAVRGNLDTKTIMIEGDGWSGAASWPTYNGNTAFISDPINNYYYEAHLYFDTGADGNSSGQYLLTYDQEAAADPNLATRGVTWLQPFATWCQTNKVPCYLGEYGIPNNDPRWLPVLNNFLAALDAAGMPGTYWAAGELWASVPTCGCSLLSVQPSNNWTTDAEQLPTLLGHLPPGSFRTASAAASFGWAVAPGQLVAGYAGIGGGLATGTGGAAQVPLLTSLEGAQVQLTDSTGNVSLAPLLYASPGQINYQVPSSGVAAGLVNVAVLNGTDTVATGVLEVASVSPTIFTANSTGQGVAAALIQRVYPDGTYDYESVSTYDAATGQFVATPIAFNGDDLYLLLYGTGFDADSGASGTSVTVGQAWFAGPTMKVLYSGPAPGYSGEDQIDAQLPTSLAGSGQVIVTVTVDGATANPVTIAFQ